MPVIERVCKITGKKFFVSELEQDLRNKFGAELPDIHPDERMRHLMTFQNSCFLYLVRCSLCKKSTLSMWGENPPFPVYCQECYRSDNWKPQELIVDPSRSFFDQFQELVNKSPHPARTLNEPIENSDYCNAATGLKNCYMSFEIGLAENCFYCHRTQYAKNCIDISLNQGGEFLYECLACTNSYQVRWSEFAVSCSDSMFLYDCVNCTSCAFSTGLRHKSFVFMNEQLTEDAYKKKMHELNTGSYEKLQEYKKQYEKLKSSYPKKNIIGLNNENVSGNIIYNCKNVENSWDARNSENIINTIAMWDTKDLLDVDTYGFGAELIHSSVAAGGQVSNMQYCSDCYTNNYNIMYSFGVTASHDCFGCAYGKNMQHSILNKEYSPEEYNVLREKIISEMKKRGEYGKMFTKQLVPFPYNLSTAYLNMPLTQQQAEKMGYLWVERKIPHIPDEQVLHAQDDIHDISWEDVEGKYIVCAKSQRPFKIIRQEFDFYKKFNIPLPRLHPEIRLLQRYPRDIFFQLHETVCKKCNTKVLTSMPVNDAVLCDTCYREKFV